ncbi:hypothetical protein BT93_C1532 [Corymbia citriodora subsp. variegata]|nr:hypothetical protein BT93_C1532 [Corymbia citriodora subsp. variegata]
MSKAHRLLQSDYHFCDSIIKPLGSIYKTTEQYVIMSKSTKSYIRTIPTIILHKVKPIICT